MSLSPPDIGSGSSLFRYTASALPGKSGRQLSMNACDATGHRIDVTVSADESSDSKLNNGPSPVFRANIGEHTVGYHFVMPERWKPLPASTYKEDFRPRQPTLPATYKTTPVRQPQHRKYTLPRSRASFTNVDKVLWP